MLFWLLVGCDDPAADRAVYQSVLSSPHPTEAALAECQRIADPTLAGDCGLVVVAAAGRDPGPLCPQLPDGVYREECWFLSAESLNRSGDALAAAARCRQAGRFALDCAQHLWQTPVRELIHAPGAAGFAEQLPRAESLYAAWEPLMVADTDFSERFWSKFFGNGFEGQGFPVDLGWCAPLPEHHQDACTSAGTAFYAREIGPRVERAGGLLVMCALEAVSVEALSVWVEAVPSPHLETAAAERTAHICTTHPALRPAQQR